MAIAAHATDGCAIDRLKNEAREFYSLPEVRAVIRPGRIDEVCDAIAARGTYFQTYEELVIGAKLAWRNHARCLGRASWQALDVIDARACRFAIEVAEGCWRHLEASTNGGQIRPTLTVFRQWKSRHNCVEILSPQLIRYAGYANPDRSTIGDPLHVDLTRLALRLGWRSHGSQFDILPLIVRTDGGDIEYFEVPRRVILEVPISHPTFEWFAELGLRWHANPAVSNMDLKIGGLTYSAAPFSGWYVGSEIGARNLSDQHRYNMLPAIAKRMGLDTSRKGTLWRDRALVELNEAVLYSYRKYGVRIIDHHTAARQFVSHVEREHAEGRHVPADWAWVNPPLSASTTATFHRTYDPPNFDLRPNFHRRDHCGDLS